MIITKKCIVCGNIFKIKTQRIRGKTLKKGFRGMNCKTCSRECAKIRINNKHRNHEM